MTGKEDEKQMMLEFISIIQDDDEDKMVCENVKKEQAQANVEMIPLLQDYNEVVKEGVVLISPNLSDVRRKYQNHYHFLTFFFFIYFNDFFISHTKKQKTKNNKKQINK